MASKRTAKKTTEKVMAPGAVPVEIPPAANAPEVPGVYSNMFEMLSMNHIDVRFAFNEVAFETGNAVKTLRRANIVMPTAAFLSMMQILNGNTQSLLSTAHQVQAQEQARMQALINARVEQAKIQEPTT